MGPLYAEMLERLTGRERPKIGPPKVTTVYKFSVVCGAEFIHLPRAIAQGLLRGNIIDSVEVHLPPVRTIEIELTAELFEDKRAICTHLMASVFAPDAIGRGICVLNLRAGIGKTFVAAGLIAALRMRTLYVVPKKPLLVQAIDDLRACFAGHEGQICKYNADNAGDLVTVIVINSALLRPVEFFAGYSFIILDEVHEYCTEKRKEIFWRQAPCILGMSATTDSAYSDIVFKKHLGDVIRAETIPGFEYPHGSQFNCVVRLIKYKGPTEYTANLRHERTGHTFVKYMYEQFMADAERNRVIVAEIIRLYGWVGPEGQRHHIYVFAEELEHLRLCGELIRAELVAQGVDIGVDIPEIDMFVGGIKDGEIARMRAESRVLLTTYGYGGTGVSIQKMTAIVFYTSRKAKMLQILARILRLGSDVSIVREVVDLIDYSTCLRWQLSTRRQAYMFYGFREVSVVVDRRVKT